MASSHASAAMLTIPYLGSKQKLLTRIEDAVASLGIKPKDGKFIDLFAGSGVVGLRMRMRGWHVETNDELDCVYPFNYVNMKLRKLPSFDGIETKSKSLITGYKLEQVLDDLNSLDPVEGFIARNYTSLHPDKARRNNFSVPNGKRIDAINEWLTFTPMSNSERIYLKACLMVAVHKFINSPVRQAVCGTRLSSAASGRLKLVPYPVFDGPQGSAFIGTAQYYLASTNPAFGDMPIACIYMDPPYTTTKYDEAFHISTTVARNDDPELTHRGHRQDIAPATGFYKKSEVEEEFFSMLTQVMELTSCLVLSYSSDGLLSHKELMGMLEGIGDVKVTEMKHVRYNPTKQADKKKTTVERIYAVKIRESKMKW